MRGLMQINPASRSCLTSPEVYVLVNMNAVAEPRFFHWLTIDGGGRQERCPPVALH